MALELECPIKRVYPSGFDLATKSAPMVPAAPDLFSITIVCPKISLILGAIARATISVPPPGAKPTIKRIGLVG